MPGFLKPAGKKVVTALRKWNAIFDTGHYNGIVSQKIERGRAANVCPALISALNHGGCGGCLNKKQW
jgi:hypothetical protein